MRPLLEEDREDLFDEFVTESFDIRESSLFSMEDSSLLEEDLDSFEESDDSDEEEELSDDNSFLRDRSFDFFFLTLKETELDEDRLVDGLTFNLLLELRLFFDLLR